MKLLLPLIIGSLALTGMVYTFVNNASPYVNIEQAQHSTGDRLHVAGDMIKESLNVEPRQRRVTFMLKDESGKTMPVVYTGNPPANMGEATRVVVIGKMQNGVFEAADMLIKCPSKYEAEAKKATT